MSTSTYDEQVARADTAIETAVSTLLNANDALTRPEALKLLAKRAVRKTTQRLLRA
jgi:hypothetical protein